MDQHNSPIGGVEVLVHVINLVMFLLFKRMLHQFCMINSQAHNSGLGHMRLYNLAVAGVYRADYIADHRYFPR